MTTQLHFVRPFALVAVLLLTPALAGCIDFQSGTVGLCVGGETPSNLLRDERCTDWVIEVDWVGGEAPNDAALDLLKQRMQGMADKDSIRIIKDQGNLQGQDEWTDNELRQLEKDTRDRVSGGETVTTHVLYVDGQLAGKPSVLGVTFSSSQLRFVVMFKDNIRQNSNEGNFLISTTLAQAEKSVLVHEFGHVIGLVNKGVPMVEDHEADECQGESDTGHSDNSASVMTCEIHTTALFDLFANSQPPTEFDADDRRDVCEFGGRC